MATAFKCDRCGKFVDRRSEIRRAYRFPLSEETLFFIKTWEFCNQCKKDFDRFANGAELKEVDE